MALHLFDKAVTNSYIAYKKDWLQKFNNRKHMSHSQFQRKIATFLCCDEPAIGSVGGVGGAAVPRLRGRHFPEKHQAAENRSMSRETPARLCHVCTLASKEVNDKSLKTSSVFQCRKCDKTLCVDGKKGNCFRIYHEAVDYVRVRLGFDDAPPQPDSESDNSLDDTVLLHSADSSDSLYDDSRARFVFYSDSD